GCSRFVQVVPQQRWVEAQVGRQAPSGPLSWPGPPSRPGPVTHMPLLHVPAHGMLQPPQWCWLSSVTTPMPADGCAAVAHGAGLVSLPASTASRGDREKARVDGLDTMELPRRSALEGGANEPGQGIPDSESREG